MEHYKSDTGRKSFIKEYLARGVWKEKPSNDHLEADIYKTT